MLDPRWRGRVKNLLQRSPPLFRAARYLAGVRAARPPTRGPLTPARYDTVEREAIKPLSVPVLMAYRPVTYQMVGFPVRVVDESELIRYVDHNFEHEVPGLFRPDARFAPIAYVNAFTPDERELFDRVREHVVRLTAKRFGRAVRPITNLMVQMGPYRIMHEIARATATRELAVFEAGPGLGYLGALLALTGHRYASFDVTQSLYLWQNRLLSAVAGGDLVETAGDITLPRLDGARIVHLPWWQFIQLLTNCPLRADIVYSNSNLGEMSLLALKYLLQIGRSMLADSKIGLFMYMSTGMLAQSTAENLAVEFSQFGYVKVCDSPFVAYTVGNRDVSAILDAFKNGVPHFRPSGAGASLTANEVMALRRAEAPVDWQITAWNYGWQAPFTD
jgi:hypothetical protein